MFKVMLLVAFVFVILLIAVSPVLAGGQGDSPIMP